MSAVLEANESEARYLAALQPALVRQFELLAAAPGGVARLRELILTLAVQGRLVPQDRSDEPASVFVESIRSRQAGPSGGRARNQTPGLVSTEEDPPFDLPIGWQWARLGSIFTLQYGAALPEKTRLAGSIPVYGSNGQVGTHCEAFVQDPSLVIGRKGSVGAVNVTSGPFWPIDTSYFVTPPEGVHLQFAYWLFRSLRLGKHDKATAIPGISRNDVYAELIALPPTAEQARIVARVDELMRLCDALEAKSRLEAEQHARLLGTLLGTLNDSSTPEELAANWQRVADHFDLLLDRPEAVDALEQTILQLAVRGRLVQQDPSDEPAAALLVHVRAEKARLIAEGKIRRERPLPLIDAEAAPFVLPAGWAWARFPELGGFGRGKSKHRPRNDPALFDPPIYPLVQTGEVARAEGTIREYHSKYSELGLAQSRLWPAGTLCITIAANIADAAVLGFDACFPDSVVGFVPARCLGGVAYFQAFLETAKTDLIRYAPATAQKNINLEILESLLVPLPPRREMERIVTRVTELRRLCADLRKRLTASQTTQSHLAAALVDLAVA